MRAACTALCADCIDYGESKIISKNNKIQDMDMNEHQRHRNEEGIEWQNKEHGIIEKG